MKLFSMFKKSAEVTPQFNDNMNYMIFEGEGIYSKTGRKRKIHIEAFSESEAIETLAAEYNPETISISRVPFESPSEDQISAMRKHGNKIPKNACKIDITFYMHKIIEHQHDPGKQLTEFATKQKVKFSYFTGEKSLYDCIWTQFSEIDKAAFYILCVKKDKTGKWNFDRFDQYKEAAKEILKDEKFMNSFKRYINSGFYGFTEETTSRSTNCYKIALTI